MSISPNTWNASAFDTASRFAAGVSPFDGMEAGSGLISARQGGDAQTGQRISSDWAGDAHEETTGPQETFLLARATGQPVVTSVTDHGWVGNPETGRVVWVRYRAMSDGSLDVLVSQDARGTGPSFSFPGEVDIGAIRDNLGDPSTSIYSISSFSPAALGTARLAAPRVVSTTDHGWVGNPATGRVVWVQYRTLSDGSHEVLVSQGARGRGLSQAFAGEVDIGTIRENLGNPATSIYGVSSFSQAALASPRTPAASPGAPVSGTAPSGQANPQVRDITDPAQILALARTIIPQKFGIALETQIGEEITLGNITIPANAKAKIQFAVPAAAFENGISIESLPEILARGSVAVSFEMAGQPAIKLTYDFPSNSFSIAQETKRISDVRLFGGLGKISWKDATQITGSTAGLGFQQGTGVTAALYLAGKDSVFSTLSNLVSAALTVAQGASIAAAIPTGGASLAGLSLMQIVKRVLTQAVANGRLSIEASYPATVSVVGGGARLQIGNNRVDIGQMGNELLRQMPIFMP
jgi:hypothetical protein